ncbi:MAG TPA: GyrI-like domain-containing protein [Phototrophicaceae bacterium]|nr:GyrI-like domain-containing protein [Phototrophicaceae bacterium]
MFRLKQAEIQTLIEEEQARLLRLEGRLQQIECEPGKLPPHEIILKQVEPQLVLSFRQQTSPAVIPQMHAELQQQLQHAGLALTSYLVIWHGCEECDDAMDLEVACPIPQAISGKHHLRVQTLAAEPTVASILHPCEPQHVCPASLELAGWIEANHYQMAANHPRREVYLTPEAGGLYIAEVQIPVQARN